MLLSETVEDNVSSSVWFERMDKLLDDIEDGMGTSSVRSEVDGRELVTDWGYAFEGIEYFIELMKGRYAK